MPHVMILKPTKTAMQSGKAKTKNWRVTFLPESTQYIEPLMQWTATKDNNSQVILRFKTLEEAKSYVEKQGWIYTIVAPHEASINPKSYADNFRANKVL